MNTDPKTFAVIGDSISTFQGYSPVGAEHYLPDLGAATGVYTVEDTWWMQVIRARGGAFLSNLSIAGNTVVTDGKMGGFPPRRLAQLAPGGRQPDCILLYAGLNDVNFYIPPQVFAREYKALLGRLQALCPQAEIWCGTLILGAIHGDETSRLPMVKALAPYNDAIRAAVQAAGCRLADLAALGRRYTSLDAFHPSGQGMAQMAGLWLEAMGG